MSASEKLYTARQLRRLLVRIEEAYKRGERPVVTLIDFQAIQDAVDILEGN